MNHEFDRKLIGIIKAKLLRLMLIRVSLSWEDNTLSAAKRLLARFPESQMWFVRVGHIAVYRIGFAGSTLEA
jgi:hypothetical protein